MTFYPYLNARSLGFNNVRSDGAEAIASLVGSLSCLTSLGYVMCALFLLLSHSVLIVSRLDSANIPASGAEAMYLHLRGHARLETLGFMCCHSTHMCSLDWNSIGDDGTAAIAVAVKTMPCLKALR